MARYRTFGIRPQHRIHVKVIEMQVNLGWPFVAHANRAVNRQLRILKLRTALQPELRARGFGIDVEIAGRLMIKCQIAHVHVRINDGLLERARALRLKI